MKNIKLYAVLAAVALTLLAVGCAQSLKRAEAELALLNETLQIHPSATVADLGAGNGKVTVALANLVPGGQVFASEIGADQRRDIEQRVRNAGIENVTVVAASQEQTGLSKACCDGILMRAVYHHLSKPEETLAGIVDALKPGGRFVVVDFPPSRWLAPWKIHGVSEGRGHGIGPDIVSREATGAGLEHVRTIESWPAMWPLASYAVVFQKPLPIQSGSAQ